jgi:hypothetical protein
MGAVGYVLFLRRGILVWMENRATAAPTTGKPCIL